MFSFKNGAEEASFGDSSMFERWENVQHYLMNDPLKLLNELQHKVRN